MFAKCCLYVALFILAKKLQIVRCLLLEKWLNKAELNVIK